MSQPAEQPIKMASIHKIMDVRTLEDWRQLFGDFTPEERKLLAEVDLDAPPTTEEQESLGPDFEAKVLELAMLVELRREQGIYDLPSLMADITPEEEQAIEEAMARPAEPLSERDKDFLERVKQKSLQRIREKREIKE